MSAAPPPSWLAPATGRTGPKSVRLRRVTTAGLGLFAVVGLLTYAVLWLRPPQAAKVVVWTAAYGETAIIPSNATGVAGATRILDTARSGRGGHFSADPQALRLTRGDFARQLADLADFRGPALVLVFAAHGGCDGQGAFLLPDDAGPDPADRIRIPTILDTLAKLPKKCRKLILFDATAAPAIPALGQFHNDFARGLAALGERIAAISNLVVVSSTGPDQRSWPAVERGTTAFLHFVKRGMQGDADANRDGRLNAAELLDFVARRTREWAADHHAALQTPTVFPAGGEGDRRAADMSLSLVDGPTPADPLPTPFAPPPEWEDAWKNYRELAAADPHPTAFAPELWRDYAAWLLRYDQLVVLDAAGASAAVQTADRLRTQLLARRVIDATPQTLRLPFALGTQPASDAVAREGVEAVAVLPDAERSKGLAAALARLGGDAVLQRLALSRAVISWLADDPLPRLATARALLVAVCEPLPLKPAEVQFVSMLASDLPTASKSTAAGPVLKRVLRLRLRAEEVANGPRGELVRPWVQRDIEKADAARSRAEDLLFLGDEKAWTRATVQAAEAEESCARAAETADAVRTAEATWQRGIADLSDLSEWLADGTRRAELPDRMKSEATLKATRSAWAAVHELASASRSEPDSARVPDLAAKTKAVVTAVAALRTSHANAVAELLARRDKLETRAEFARWWAAAESALTVPGGAERKELVTEFRRASRQLTVTDATTPDPQAAPSAEVAREVARHHASRRGLLHLARLGQPGTDVPPLAFQFDQFAKLADATEMLTEASDTLAARFVAVAARVATDAAEEATLPNADRLARVSVLPTTADAANRLRRLRVAELLEWQATRAEADFWAGNDGTATPYFQRAARALRADAATLRDRPANPSARPDGLPFTLTAPARRAVTDELSPRVAFALSSEKSPPFRAGVVAFWDAAAPDRRWPRDTTEAKPGDLVIAIPARTEPVPTAPVVESSAVAVTGYFRGRTFNREVAIDRHPVPHVTAVNRPLGELASVAVRADASLRTRYGNGSGSLHFVVDATGSMGADPDTPGDPGRYPVACAALEAVLKSIPPGVSVAVSAFGHRTAPKDDGGFETLLPFTAWTLDAGKQTDAVLTRLRALQPWDESPVVRSVLRAKETLKGRAGATAVVLIGDGVDTKFADDAEANPKKLAVKDAIRTAFSTDTAALHVVAVTVTDKAEKAAQDEFRVVAECKPAGLFVAPDATAELVKWIRAATAARIKVTVADDGGPRDLLTGSDSGDNWLSPTVPPGKYSARATLAKPVEQQIDLKPGERLLLALEDGSPEPRFVRPNAAADLPAVSRKTAGAWTAAVPRQRLLDSGGLELAVALDRAGAATNVLSPARLADVWFDLSPAVPRPVAVRWTTDPGWPAPTWQLSTRSWPKDGAVGSPAKLTAWWAEDKPFPVTATWKPELGPPLVGHSPATVNCNAIESVTVEEHEVEVKPDTRAKRSCLVVRLGFDPKETLVARPTGGAPTGSESRVYQAAGKATCLFWWADAEAVKAVTGFELVSVSAAKKFALSAELPTLPPPAAGGPVPTPAPR